MAYFQLLPVAPFGVVSVAMEDEDAVGMPFFVDATSSTLGDPPRDRVEVTVDAAAGEFDRLRPDYLQTTKGIPLVSERFLDVGADDLRRDIEAVPATLRLNGGTREAWALRILTVLPLIDPDASAFSTIRGIRILTDPVFRDVSGSFHLARDAVFRGHSVASPSMARLIEEHALTVDVLPFG